MLDIIEKNAILLASLIVLLISYRKNGAGIDTAVFIFLISMIFTELGIYVRNVKNKLALLAMYIVACLVRWEFILFLPVVVFFLIEERLYYGLFVLGFYLPLYLKTESIAIVCVELIICAISGLLAYENVQVKKYRQKYLDTRDSSTELENQLKKKTGN